MDDFLHYSTHIFYTFIFFIFCAYIEKGILSREERHSRAAGPYHGMVGDGFFLPRTGSCEAPLTQITSPTPFVNDFVTIFGSPKTIVGRGNEKREPDSSGGSGRVTWDPMDV